MRFLQCKPLFKITLWNCCLYQQSWDGSCHKTLLPALVFLCCLGLFVRVFLNWYVYLTVRTVFVLLPKRPFSTILVDFSFAVYMLCWDFVHLHDTKTKWRNETVMEEGKSHCWLQVEKQLLTRIFHGDITFFTREFMTCAHKTEGKLML